MFDEICNEQATIVKADGTRRGPYKCSLSSTQATIFDGDLDVAAGDRLERVLPSDRTEDYSVLEATFNNKFHGIPAHWVLDLKKAGSLKSHGGSTAPTINIHDSYGVQVGDHNRQDIILSVQQLVTAIHDSDASDEDKAEAKSRIKTLIEHPLVAAILGGATGGLLGML